MNQNNIDNKNARMPTPRTCTALEEVTEQSNLMSLNDSQASAIVEPEDVIGLHPLDALDACIDSDDECDRTSYQTATTNHMALRTPSDLEYMSVHSSSQSIDTVGRSENQPNSQPISNIEENEVTLRQSDELPLNFNHKTFTDNELDDIFAQPMDKQDFYSQLQQPYDSPTALKPTRFIDPENSDPLYDFSDIANEDDFLTKSQIIERRKRQNSTPLQPVNLSVSNPTADTSLWSMSENDDKSYVNAFKQTLEAFDFKNMSNESKSNINWSVHTIDSSFTSSVGAPNQQQESLPSLSPSPKSSQTPHLSPTKSVSSEGANSSIINLAERIEKSADELVSARSKSKHGRIRQENENYVQRIKHERQANLIDTVFEQENESNTTLNSLDCLNDPMHHSLNKEDLEHTPIADLGQMQHNEQQRPESTASNVLTPKSSRHSSLRRSTATEHSAFVSTPIRSESAQSGPERVTMQAPANWNAGNESTVSSIHTPKGTTGAANVVETPPTKTPLLRHMNIRTRPDQSKLALAKSRDIYEKSNAERDVSAVMSTQQNEMTSAMSQRHYQATNNDILINRNDIFFGCVDAGEELVTSLFVRNVRTRPINVRYGLVPSTFRAYDARGKSVGGLSLRDVFVLPNNHSSATSMTEFLKPHNDSSKSDLTIRIAFVPNNNKYTFTGQLKIKILPTGNEYFVKLLGIGGAAKIGIRERSINDGSMTSTMMDTGMTLNGCTFYSQKKQVRLTSINGRSSAQLYNKGHRAAFVYTQCPGGVNAQPMSTIIDAAQHQIIDLTSANNTGDVKLIWGDELMRRRLVQYIGNKQRANPDAQIIKSRDNFSEDERLLLAALISKTFDHQEYCIHVESDNPIYNNVQRHTELINLLASLRIVVFKIRSASVDNSTVVFADENCTMSTTVLENKSMIPPRSSDDRILMPPPAAPARIFSETKHNQVSLMKASPPVIRKNASVAGANDVISIADTSAPSNSVDDKVVSSKVANVTEKYSKNRTYADANQFAEKIEKGKMVIRTPKFHERSFESYSYYSGKFRVENRSEKLLFIKVCQVTSPFSVRPPTLETHGEQIKPGQYYSAFVSCKILPDKEQHGRLTIEADEGKVDIQLRVP